MARSAGIRRVAEVKRDRSHGRAEPRRQHRDGERADLHRRDHRQPLARLRIENRKTTVGSAARRTGAFGAHDVHGQGSPAVRRRRRRWRRIPAVAGGNQARRLRVAGRDVVASGACSAARQSEACACVGRRAKRISARIDLARVCDDRTARTRVRRVRHLLPHRLSADHEASDHVQDRDRHRDWRAAPRTQSRLLRRDLFLRRPRDRSDGETAR